MVVTPQALDRAHALTRVTARTRAWPAELRERILTRLAATDPRRNLQGWAEVAVLSVLEDSGATVTEVHPATVGLTTRSGNAVRVRTLAFALATDPLAEDAARRALESALARVRGPRSLMANVRRCVPGTIDRERLRDTVQAWWDSGATTPLRLEDAATAVEVVAPHGGDAGSVAPPHVIVRGPWHTHRTMEALEPRLVHEALLHAAGCPGEPPLVLACVADPAWPMYAVRDGGGWLRDMLYGPPRESVSAGEGGAQAWTYVGAPTASLYRDPALGELAGLMFLDRVSATRARVRAHLNPWCAQPLAATDLAACVGSFRAVESRSDSVRDNVALRWYEALAPEHEL